MKKDNKKALYESIMTSVAKEIKKALNEEINPSIEKAKARQKKIENAYALKLKEWYNKFLKHLRKFAVTNKHILANNFVSKEDWDNFVTSNSQQPQGHRTASRCVERLLLKIGVEYKGFHAFRHSYATKMLESGINAKVVSDLLGHSNISTTLNIYSHTSNDLKKECVDKVFKDDNYEKKKEKKELYQQILDMQKTMNELLIKVSNLQEKIYGRKREV